MRRFIFILFALISCSLHADLEDHLHKVEGKTALSTMRNIDFIYLINLDQRPEKYRSCVEQLSPYGILPHRFSAVNGWKLSLDEINDLGVKFAPWMQEGQLATCYPLDAGGKPLDEPMYELGRTYFYHTMAPGAMGCVLSHLSVLRDAYDSGYETIWVMEDDIAIAQNPHLLSDLIEELDKEVGKDGWDILFTDRETKSQAGLYVPCFSYALRPNFIPENPTGYLLRQEISPNLRQVGARFGSYSMIVRRSGMKKLLDFIDKYSLFLPYDMEYSIPPGIRLFTVNVDVVSTQPQAPTDNGVCNYHIQTEPNASSVLLVSLGSSCEAAEQLRQNTLREKAYPFDWMMTMSPEGIVSLFHDDFTHFLNPDYLFRNPESPLSLEHALYQIEFRHDWPSNPNASLIEQVEEFSPKYTHRIARFRDLDNFPGKVVFLRIAYHHEVRGSHYWLEKNPCHIDASQAQMLSDALSTYFPHLDFLLAVINYEEDNVAEITGIDRVASFQVSKNNKNHDYTALFQHIIEVAHAPYTIHRKS